MADNPIKHKDIIEEGNPFDAATKGLLEMMKLLDKTVKGLKKSAKEWQTFTQKQNAATKEGQQNLKKAATATAKLSVKEKEALKLKQQLQREQAKLNLMNTKEYKQLLQTKEATRAKNAELKKAAKAMTAGAKTTNTWSKAAGSFAAKFNTLGNVAGIAIAKIAAGLKSAVTKFISFQKIINSNQITADKYDVVVGRLKGSFEALNRAIALRDFSNLRQEMRDAADAAENYILVLDKLNDTQNALDIQTARSRKELALLRQVSTDTSQATEDRMAAAQKAASILTELQTTQERIKKEAFENELSRVQGIVTLTKEQESLYQRFIENYGLLSDEQVTNLEALEAQYVTVGETATENWKLALSAGTLAAQGGLRNKELIEDTSDAIDENKVELTEYEKTVADLSKTMKVDLNPVMEAIIGSADEQRTAFVNSIIAYERQIEQTVVLANENVRMIGTLKNATKAVGELTEALDVVEIEDIVGEDDFDITTMFDKDFQATEIENLKFLNGLYKRFRAQFKSDEEQADQEQEGRDKKKIDDINAGIDAAQQASDAFFSFSQTQSDNKYKAELEAANGNAAEIERIQEEQAKEDQKRAVSQALVNGALGATKTIANLGFPAAIPALIAQAAVLAFQIAAITSVQFEEGGSGMLDDKGHILQGPSHGAGGINPQIEAEGGEYFGIINKHMTRKYQSELPGIFESINNGRFHDVFSRSNIELNKASIFNDPWGKNIYDLLKNQPSAYNDSEGNQVLLFPDGRKRVIKQHGI